MPQTTMSSAVMKAPLRWALWVVLLAGAGDIGVVAQEIGARGHLKEERA